MDSDAKDVCDDYCSGSADRCNFGDLDCSYYSSISSCDIELGAGSIIDTQKVKCPIDGDKRFITHEQTNLLDTFECLATVGTYGSGNEKPMTAMVAALGDATNNGGCNDQFLRDDAILVVTVVSDAPPDSAKEQVGANPMDWYNALVTAKNGDESAISLIGFVSDGDIPGGICECLSGPECEWRDDAKGAPVYRDFVDAFGTKGFLCSVCEPDYTSCFANAVNIIDKSCNAFIPPQ